MRAQGRGSKTPSPLPMLIISILPTYRSVHPDGPGDESNASIDSGRCITHIPPSIELTSGGLLVVQLWSQDSSFGSRRMVASSYFLAPALAAALVTYVGTVQETELRTATRYGDYGCSFSEAPELLGGIWESVPFQTLAADGSFFSTALMMPTATVCRMSRTAKRPSGG